MISVPCTEFLTWSWLFGFLNEFRSHKHTHTQAPPHPHPPTTTTAALYCIEIQVFTLFISIKWLHDWCDILTVDKELRSLLYPAVSFHITNKIVSQYHIFFNLYTDSTHKDKTGPNIIRIHINRLTGYTKYKILHTPDVYALTRIVYRAKHLMYQ